ncbi:MAG: 30S ribosomal protein S8 [Terriglobia bacterium]
MGAPTDPIADMLTAIRNALRARHPKVDVPASRVKAEIARVLKEEGFVAAFKVIEEKKNRKTLRLYLKYGEDKANVISGLRRVSKPGRRVYRARKEIKPVYGGLGINIVTTPQGIMSGRRARRQGVGGEILCEVW